MTDVPAADVAVRVNKRELARLLDCSLPTVDALIARYPDLPVIKRGTNGDPWEFDPAAVTGFLADRRAEEAQAVSAKSELLAQLALPIASPLGGEPGLKPQDRLAHVRALTAEDDLAVKRRFLVHTAEVRAALLASIAAWNRDLHAAIRQAGAALNLPDSVTRALDTALAAAQTQFVRRLPDYLRSDTTGEADDAGSLRLG